MKKKPNDVVKSVIIILMLSFILSLVIPIGKWWVDDRWVYGCRLIPHGVNSQTMRLTVWEYVDAKRHGFLYEKT